MKLGFSFVCLSLLAAAAQTTQPKKEVDSIRVMPVRPTPEPEATSLYLSLPRDREMVKKSPVWIQVRLEGYPLGTDSAFDRASEVVNSNLGQTLHVIIDNYPYFPVNEPALDPFREQGNYYVVSYKFEVPFRLQPGFHTIRAFPARSFGESLKGENTFAVSTFYLESEEDNLKVNLSKPYLTYNEPGEETKLVENRPILLDFYISNCALSADGYKVRLIIDGQMTRTLTSWVPYYLYGLKKGKHTVRLELIDSSGKIVPGPFNSTERTITVR